LGVFLFGFGGNELNCGRGYDIILSNISIKKEKAFR
jgi:hypothetical protein